MIFGRIRGRSTLHDEGECVVLRNPPSRRQLLLAPVAALIVVLLLLLSVFSSKYTDLLWFRDVSRISKSPYTNVFSVQLQTKVALFFGYGLLMSLIVGANVWVAYRIRPPYRPQSLEQENLDRYRSVVEPHARSMFIALLGVLALISGSSGTGSWRTWQLWINRQPFGVQDPVFHKDIGYYAFTYPLYRQVVGFAFGAFFFATLAAIATHYLFGAVRVQTRGEKVIPAARAHISVLLGVLAALKAVFYYLDRYGMVFSRRGSVTGASYTDIHARLPVLLMLVFAAALCALLFIANLRSRGFLLPGVAFALLVASSILLGFVYPLVVQSVQVRPNELRYERPYIQRNIDATRKAYGINEVKTEPFQAAGTAQLPELTAAGGTLDHVRLLDPNKLKATFEQLQAIRQYYGFADTLDIDRYADPDGQVQDYVVGVREADLSKLPADQRGNWLNEHVLYTHGTGFVAVPTDAVTADGKPNFAVKDIPTTGFLKIDEPRVYFGELSPAYSIIGSPTSGEVDGLSDISQGTGYRYTGPAGITLGGIRRLLYAVRFREPNLLISSAIDGNARILYGRSPRDRVQQVAPYLKLDSDPYPAVINGRITWILDGYTTSAGYPYAQLTDLDKVTRDTTTTLRPGEALPSEQINYIRNSVKATVDAFDGSVHLYTWDDKDPVLKTWKKVFPGTVLDKSAMPAGVLEHLRYPEDLFKVQRGLLERYHVTDPTMFFSRQQDWSVPTDPAVHDPDNKLTTTVKQPPYYLVLKQPASATRSFSLTTPFVFKNNLAAFASVSSDKADYGTIRILTVPSTGSVQGPGQVAQAFRSDARFSRDETQLGGGSSSVIYGNLLTLPVGQQLVYVQPIYVKSKEDTAYPTLQRVLVGYGNKVGYGNSFSEALRDAVTQTSTGTGPAPPSPGGTPTPPVSGSSSPAPPNVSSSPGPVPATVAEAVTEALAAEKAAQDALQKSPPDFAAYDVAQRRLRDALGRIAQLTNTPTAGASTGTPSSVPGPSAASSSSAAPSPSG